MDKMPKTIILFTGGGGGPAAALPAEKQICTCKHQSLSASSC